MTVVDWCYEDDGTPITIAEPVEPIDDGIFCDGFDGGDGSCAGGNPN